MRKPGLVFGLLFLNCGICSISPPESTLKTLNAQIKTSKQKLDFAHQKKSNLYQLLALKEKEMGLNFQKLKKLTEETQKNASSIDAMQRQIERLNRTVENQKTVLAKQLNAHFRISRNLEQNRFSPEHGERVVTYSNYLIAARKKALDTLLYTKNRLHQESELLKTILGKQQQIKTSLTRCKQQLDVDKAYQHGLIKALAREIQTEQQSLLTFEKNRENLTRLIRSLQSSTQRSNTKSFQAMRHHLPKPIALKAGFIKPVNQGLRFLTKEGTAVFAVFPGKVVFSDWLKGYGLLLILDHGQGYMTLYSHNQALFKSKGQDVKQGEQIATVGQSGGIQQSGLYFEIRHNGRPLPALQWIA